MSQTATPTPFTIAVTDEKLAWIQDRVKTALVIPDVEHPAGDEWAAWVDGPPTTAIQALVDYWRTSYDWRKVEARLNNTFRMFTVPIEEQGETFDVHFAHHRSTRKGAVPMIYVHGWPGSFLESEALVERLVEPEDPNAQAFHIVAPSLPGYAFGGRSKRPGLSVATIGHIFNTLMVTILGYPSYIAQGGDWGSMIIRRMAAQHPSTCIAAHTNFPTPFGPPSALKHPLALFWLATRWFTPAQKERLARMMAWRETELGYALIHGEKPQTISYALLDSPVGMLAWLYDKARRVVDPANVYLWERDDADKERMITWTMLYLLSENSAHARMYKDNMHGMGDLGAIDASVAVGVSAFRYDLGYMPKWWADVSLGYNITFWREHEAGGHFPTLECPGVFARDLQDFVGSVPQACLQKLRESGEAAGN
ncbi:epoxide hydrolase domain-containing protein [Coniophora puteana RWD-64-598 SS2]|uniref:Epoxide hydrolase domain-containing protein n=1 Tax=Coniophora puteana (strain RWD-64-598) TaxID=741705 RepID=A0A5M3MEU4_CONPW|nr:epoxide hydrolase domain-containing protein [Coniophora puteana RWD-64-598 SS2]EIW77440.1 epoxide hydrolase domain-containing protein [Coniophora puteana RWD-64-598 SS2]